MTIVAWPDARAGGDAPAAIDWMQLVKAEYLEMPGLQLTHAQVRRLWGLDEPICHEILEQLVATHFLRLTTHDCYVLDAACC